MDDPQNRVIAAYRHLYGGPPPILVRAPGRVNLIGEHTDYNAGFVMPMAIDRAAWIALRPLDAPRVSVHSLDFDQVTTFGLDPIEHAPGHWSDYVRGVGWAMETQGYRLRGWEGVMAGDVPRGAGLSSSAALELAVARAFAAVAEARWDTAAMALICQQAENCWVGVNCGIMDQMISAAGEKDHALLIDCRSLGTTPVPLPSGAAVVVLDTATRRGLVDSAYNERRAQCEAAAAFFRVPALRDVTLAQLEDANGRLAPLEYRRARHVITENDRVLAAAAAMRADNAAALGQLLDASHESLRDDFQVSSAALDAIVACAQAHPACYGARMTGAGFGGCAVALVGIEATGDFAAAVARCYAERVGREPRIYVCRATDGAQIASI